MRVSQGKIKDSLCAELGFESVSFLEHLSNPGGLFQRFLDFHGYEQKKTPDKVIEVDGLFLHETAQNDTIRQDRVPGAKEQRIIGVDRKSKISLEYSGEPVDNRRESRGWHGAKSRVNGWVKFLFPTAPVQRVVSAGFDLPLGRLPAPPAPPPPSCSLSAPAHPCFGPTLD